MRRLKSTGPLRSYCNRRSHCHRVEEFLHLDILQRDAAPCPITAGAVSVYVDVAAEPGVLRRCGSALDCPNDCVMLRLANQVIAQAPLGVLHVWITHTQRQVERALVVFREDVKLAFGRGAIALAT